MDHQDRVAICFPRTLIQWPPPRRLRSLQLSVTDREPFCIAPTGRSAARINLNGSTCASTLFALVKLRERPLPSPLRPVGAWSIVLSVTVPDKNRAPFHNLRQKSLPLSSSRAGKRACLIEAIL